MLKFADISLEIPYFQAPLSGYSDLAMRTLAREFGAPLVFAPVVLAKSAANAKVIRKGLLKPAVSEGPIGAQVLGRDPKTMAKAAAALSAAGFCVIDLNFACPAPKVLRRRRGGALLNEPRLAVEIYREVREAVNIPVTVKLRTGFDDSSESAVNFYWLFDKLAESGVEAVTIHGRTVEQKFRGSADWEIVAEVKRRFAGLTIIGSGDLFEAEDIVRKVRDNGVDGGLIARGAVGNPWIFAQLRDIYADREVRRPSLSEQGKVILRHLKLSSGLYEAGKAVRFLRKFLVQYVRQHPERRKVQRDLLKATSIEQLTAAVEKWYQLN